MLVSMLTCLNYCLGGGGSWEVANLCLTPVALFYYNVPWLHDCGPGNTVVPEIFARVLVSLNFTVGVGPCKLNMRNFQRTRKFWLHGIHLHLQAMWFPRHCWAVTLLIFLNKLLTMSHLQYLQPASNKCQAPKWVCLIFCMHMEPSYLNAKVASSDPPFDERLLREVNSH